jgi:hypothetical protein
MYFIRHILLPTFKLVMQCLKLHLTMRIGQSFTGQLQYLQPYLGVLSGCGKCWKVTGTTNLGSYDSATISALVLKGANLCPSENEACSGEKVHFDIAAPGFDVNEFSLAQDCGALDPAEIDGYLGCKL